MDCLNVTRPFRLASTLAACVLLVARSQAVDAQQVTQGRPCEADPLRRTVCAVDDSLGAALTRADTAAIARIYSDDLVSTNYRGVRSTKPVLLNAIATRRLRFDTLVVLRRAVDVRADTAVVLERMYQVVTGAEGRHPPEVDYRRAYVLHGRQWQLVSAVIGLPAQ